MKTLFSAAALGAVILATAGAANASLLYSMDFITSYGFTYPGPAGTFLGGADPGPDTGFASFRNNGPSIFVGTVGDVAVDASSTDWSQSHGVTLNPGDVVYFSINPESSNYGGFGANGVQLFANGVFGATSVSLNAFDGDIHSGSVNGGGATDAFVLQGGCPSGCDYGDEVETTQSPGLKNFQARGETSVPEPASWALMLTGFLGVGAAVRSARKTAGVTV